MFDVQRLMEVMSEILSDKYGVNVTMTAVPKEQGENCARSARR